MGNFNMKTTDNIFKELKSDKASSVYQLKYKDDVTFHTRHQQIVDYFRINLKLQILQIYNNKCYFCVWAPHKSLDCNGG